MSPFELPTPTAIFPKAAFSRLTVGTTLTRGDLMHLALMSSENRAAHALGNNYPGGMRAMVAAMNAKAKALGMTIFLLRRSDRPIEPERGESRGSVQAGDRGIEESRPSANIRPIRNYVVRVAKAHGRVP